MKNVSAFVVLGAFIISVVLTGCADLDNALSSLKVDQQKDSLTEDIDRAKTVKKLSYLTDSASRIQDFEVIRARGCLPASHPHLTNKKVSRIIDSLTQSTLYLS